MNTKTTRRALVMSALSLLLCISMLLGTTFAWFTDSVTSANNIVKSGNLDVVLEYWDGDSYEEVTSTTKLFDDAALWEPGYTEVAYLKVSNTGSLALKYQLAVNVFDETIGKTKDGADIKLSDHLVFSVVEKQLATEADMYTRDAARTAAGDVQGLKSYNSGTKALQPKNAEGAGDSEDYVALIIYMPENVGNDANHNGVNVPSIEMGVNLLATQLDAESDSFDSDYDVNAWVDGFDVYTEQELVAAIINGETNIDVMSDIAVDESINIPKGATVAFNLNGNKITSELTSGRAFLIEGTVEIKNGMISTTSGVGGFYVTGSSASLTLSDMTVAVTGVGTNAEWNHAAVGAANGAKLVINGGTYSAEKGYGLVVMTSGADVTINEGTFTTEGTTESAAVRFDSGWDNSKIYTKATINGGVFNAPEGGLAFVANNAYGKSIAINGGIFNGEIETAYQDDGVVINGGIFNKTIFQGGGHQDKYVIKGGTFVEDVSSKLAEGAMQIKNADGTFTVVNNTADTTLTMADGATLDLKGTEFAGTVVAQGDLTIKGDTKIKTLSATQGGTITIEEGKTLTLNNFSFGNKSNNTAQYTITGGKVVAAYGFFQHGKYDLRSDFETGYMYYSYGSDITVYGTFHSQGKGDGLDYVRGKLTIASGGKSIHDKSLWIGQPASWGAMNASLTVEEGGYVQADSLSVYEGSVAYNSAANVGNEEVGIKYNTLTGTITVQ